jgi:hypothetical protein
VNAHFYVYEHWRPDTGTIFYVGKGKGRRAQDMKGERSRWHRFVVRKLDALGHAVEVRIVYSNLVESDAFAKEIERIAYWRAQGALLVNMTNGGEGASGALVSAATRALISDRSKGRKHSEETRAKMSTSAAGNKRALGYKRKPHEIAAISARSKGKSPSRETREKMRLAKLGRKITDAHKANIRASVRLTYANEEIRKKCVASPEGIERARLANIGRKQSPETIAKKSRAIRGQKRSEETRRLMSESQKRIWANKARIAVSEIRE